MFTLSAEWTDDGEFSGVDYGVSVASAGDINGDGFADVIVGAQKYLIDDERCGAAFVYLGGGGGLTSYPHKILSSGVYGSYFGGAVDTAGDVNGDGYDDVIIGSPNHKEFVSNEPRGAAYLYFGSPSGLQDAADWAFISPTKDSQFGYAVSGVGDVNGDGFDDVLIGANIYKNVETNEGAAFLFLGSGSGLGSEPAWIFESNQAGAQAGYALAGIGDIDGDLLADVLISAPTYDYDGKTDAGMIWIFTGMDSPLGLSSIPYWSASGTQNNEQFGSAVDGAGDVNGDGYLDLIVGARGYDEDLVDIGAAYLFTNSSSGMKSAADWKVSSDQIYSGFGISVAGLGDVNLDGFDDVAVGAHHYTDDQSLEGMVFAYRGSPIGLETTPKWTGGGNKADADFGFSIANAGDVDDDGSNDLLVGAPLYKRDERIVMGQASLYLGLQTGEVIIYNTFLPMLMTGQ